MDQIIEERKRSKQESIQKEIEYIKLQNKEMEESLEAPMESSDDEEGQDVISYREETGGREYVRLQFSENMEAGNRGTEGTEMEGEHIVGYRR